MAQMGRMGGAKPAGECQVMCKPNGEALHH